jgi:hypothetical protein
MFAGDAERVACGVIGWAKSGELVIAPLRPQALLARFIRYAPELNPLRADPRFAEHCAAWTGKLADNLSAH